MDSREFLKTIETYLEANGVSASAADPWDAWKLLKRLVRENDRLRYDGFGVQTVDRPDSFCLVFVCQICDPVEEDPEDDDPEDPDWLAPIGGVILELEFPPITSEQEWEIWTLDYPAFDDFVDAVEGNSAFSKYVVKSPIASSIYWQEA